MNILENPTLYREKWGLWVYIIFLFGLKSLVHVYSLEEAHWGSSNKHPQSVCSKNMETIINYHLINAISWFMKCCIALHGQVNVRMIQLCNIMLCSWLHEWNLSDENLRYFFLFMFHTWVLGVSYSSWKPITYFRRKDVLKEMHTPATPHPLWLHAGNKNTVIFLY